MVSSGRADRTHGDDALASAQGRAAAFAAVFEAVDGRIPPGRVRAQVKRLVPRRLGRPPEDAAADILDLAIDLVRYDPDPKGRTAFDRLAAAGALPDGGPEAAALAALRAARFTVLEVTASGGGAGLVARDRLTGAVHGLGEGALPPGALLAGRLAVTPDGRLVPAGPVACLPVPARARVEGLLAETPGSAFRRPDRVAEALYRDLVAHAAETGEPVREWLVELEEADGGPAGEPKVRFERGRWRVAPDAPEVFWEVTDLADCWAALDSPEPERADPAGARWLREAAHPGLVYTIVALADHVPDDHPQARALEAMAGIALDTVERRAAAGMGESLAAFERGLDAPGAGLPPSAVGRLERLRRRVAAGGGTADPELDRVIARIRALRAKTEDAGCTEAEAMAAAEKAEELLRRYDIQLTPEAIADSACTAAHVPTPRKRQDGLDTCAHGIAGFCECTHWLTAREDGRLVHVFFGLPADVAAAESLFHVVAETFAVETGRFKAGPTYRETPSASRGQATKSFRHGLARGIREKLDELARQRVRHTRGATGRDLVPLKRRAIDDALERLGLAFRSGRRGSRHLDPEAYHQGVSSGRAFQPETGVESGPRSA